MTYFQETRQKIAREFFFLTQNQKEINLNKLAKKFEKSVKQMRRLYKLWSSGDKNFNFHKNTNKPSIKKISDEINNKIVNEYVNINAEILSKFEERDKFKPLHHFEFYKEFDIQQKFKVTYQHVNKILKRHFLPSPKSRHSTKRQLNKLRKEMEQSDCNENLKHQTIQDITMDYNMENVRIYKGKTGCFGNTIELDACCHRWFNHEKYYIYAAVDSFTGMLLGMHIEKEETTNGYYNLLLKVFKKYGIPKIIKTDRRITFWKKDTKTTPLTQCLQDLDITVLSSSEPTFKPNVERLFGTLQTRLLAKLYKLNVCTLNDLLDKQDYLIQWYNTEFNKVRGLKSEFKLIDPSTIQNRFVRYSTRKVISGNFVSYEGKRYAPFNDEGRRVMMVEGGSVNVYTDFNQPAPFVKKGSQRYYLQELTDNEIYMSDLSDELQHKNDIINKLEMKLDRSYNQITELKIFIKKLKDQLYPIPKKV